MGNLARPPDDRRYDRVRRVADRHRRVRWIGPVPSDWGPRGVARYLLPAVAARACGRCGAASWEPCRWVASSRSPVHVAGCDCGQHVGAVIATFHAARILAAGVSYAPPYSGLSSGYETSGSRSFAPVRQVSSSIVPTHPDTGKDLR